MIGDAQIFDIIMAKYGNKNAKTINDLYEAIIGKTMKDSPDKARAEIYDYLSNNARFTTGEKALKDSLGVSKAASLDKDIIYKTVQNLFKVVTGQREPDNKDELRNKDAYDENDFIMEKFEEGFKNPQKHI
jgi:DNA-directed RNA polymerase beta subunit